MCSKTKSIRQNFIACNLHRINTVVCFPLFCIRIHGWEKQQTQRPKASEPKRVRHAKKPTKRNPATGKKTHFKSIYLDKIYIHKNKNIQTVNKKKCKKK